MTAISVAANGGEKKDEFYDAHRVVTGIRNHRPPGFKGKASPRGGHPLAGTHQWAGYPVKAFGQKTHLTAFSCGLSMIMTQEPAQLLAALDAPLSIEVTVPRK
jgi:hypothetical protein